jgi:hypothetical protein
MKTKTIPMLELCAMSFAVKTVIDMYNDLINSFCPVNISGVHVYSDSMIALNWLTSKVCTFGKIERKGTCINNQLNSIVDYCKIHTISFHHIGGVDNPADKVSRCVSAKVLSKTTFLSGPNVSPELSDTNFVTVPTGSQFDNSLVCNAVNANVIVSSPVIPFDRYSSYRKMSNITHLALKFVHLLKKKVNTKRVDRFSGCDKDYSYKDTSTYLVKQAQHGIFAGELEYLNNPSIVPHKAVPLVTQLNLFLDDDGVIRVRGKMKNLNASYSEKFPILLHKSCKLAHLIISDFHCKYKHLGVYKILALLRREFWVTSSFVTVKKVVNKCLVCKVMYGRSVAVNKNSYRNYRVNPIEVPYREIALDHIGPFTVKVNDTNSKVYILIITCFWSRAVHLILCNNLENKTFLMNFQEHIFAYGIPSRIIADNGSSIVSSVHQIQKFLEDTEVRNFLTERKIEQLTFEPYPSQASYLGGIVESLVKQVKFMILSSVGKNVLPYDQFNFYVKECNMLINKRPITCTPLLINPNTDSLDQVLTPEKLVKGYDVPSIAVIPYLSTEDSSPGDSLWHRGGPAMGQQLWDSFSRLSKVRSRLRDIYFDKFIQNLQSQGTRSGNFEPKNHILLSAGDLVAVKTKFVKPYFYPTGIIVNIEQNDLEEVTTVSLKKSNGEIIRRHVTDIILLEKSVTTIAPPTPIVDISQPLRRSARLAGIQP